MSVRFWRSAGCFGASYKYLLRHRCEYTTGFLERGCGREADKARGVAECLIRLRDHIRVQEIP